MSVRKMPDLNIPALEDLARWLEAGAPEAEARGMKFDMRSIFVIDREKYLAAPENISAENWCGSTCCMAGYLIARHRPDLLSPSQNWAVSRDGTLLQVSGVALWQSAVDILHGSKTIRSRISNMLFEPWEAEGTPGPGSHQITPTWAARVVRHLIATGEVDWWGNEVAQMEVQP